MKLLFSHRNIMAWNDSLCILNRNLIGSNEHTFCISLCWVFKMAALFVSECLVSSMFFVLTSFWMSKSHDSMNSMVPSCNLSLSWTTGAPVASSIVSVLLLLLPLFVVLRRERAQ